MSNKTLQSLPPWPEDELSTISGGSGKGGAMPNINPPNTLDWLNRNRPLPQTPNIPRVSQPPSASVNVNVTTSGPPAAWSAATTISGGFLKATAHAFSSPNPTVGNGVGFGIGKKF
jgi:hypothetical protein